MKRSIFITTLVFGWIASSAQEMYSQQKIERLYKTGIELIEKREFGAAKKTFREFLLLQKGNDNRTVEAEYFNAFCALNLYHQDGEKLVSDFILAHAENPRAASIYYDLGNFFYAEKNYGKAVDYFSKVDFSALTGTQINIGRFKWGYSLFNNKKLSESLDQFNFVKTSGGQFGPASSYYAGFIEYSQGSYESALSDLKRAGENESYSSIVPYLICSTYFKQKKYDELLSFINSIRSTNDLSNSTDIALLGAEASFEKQDYKKAYEGYSKFLEGKATLERGVLSRAGYSAFSIGKDDDALGYFKGAASNKDSIGFYSSYYLGALYLKKNQKPLALNAFESAKKFVADKRIAEESLYQFSKIAFDLDRGDVALDGLKSFIKLYPKSDHLTEAKELLSQAYVTTNNYDKAISYIEALDGHGDALDKAYQKACFLKGVEFFNKENYEQAKIYFLKSLKRPLNNNYKAEALFWMGEVHSIEKNNDLAIESYSDVFQISSYGDSEVLLKARYGLGYAYFNSNQFEKALFNFKEYVVKSNQQNSNYGDATLRLADCYYVAKQYSDALTNYKKSAGFKFDADYAVLQAGNIFSILGNFSEAKQNFETVIKKYPSSRFIDEAMFQIAQLDFEQGNYAVAISEFSKLIDSGKPSKFIPYAYVRRASSYHNLKAFDKTSTDYISVLDLFPTHPVVNDILLPLQEALTNAGRASEFDKYLAQVKSTNPNAKGVESAEFESSKGFYFNQDYSKAIQALGSYVSSYPESPRVDEANYYRAESFYRLKDFAKALDIYGELSARSNFSLANKVIGRIAELEFKKSNYERAIPAFIKLYKAASTKKELFSAWSGLMESHYQLTNYDSVIFYAHLILEKAKVNAGAENKASLYLGKAALGKGELENAKDEFLNTLNNAQDEYGAEAKYLLGELQFAKKEYKECYQTLTSLNTDFSAYPLWRGKAYLLLADYFVAVDDSFNARASLQSLIDNTPIQSIKEKAKDKLRQLEENDSKKLVRDTVFNKKN
jgi:tetratricopeptide (TPR) repeat protein